MAINNFPPPSGLSPVVSRFSLTYLNGKEPCRISHPIFVETTANQYSSLLYQHQNKRNTEIIAMSFREPYHSSE
jgi:hypothetical protein